MYGAGVPLEGHLLWNLASITPGTDLFQLILIFTCLVQLYGLSTSDQSISSGEMQERSEEVKTLAAGSSIGQQVLVLPSPLCAPTHGATQPHACLHPHASDMGGMDSLGLEWTTGMQSGSWPGMHHGGNGNLQSKHQAAWHARCGTGV